MRRVIIALARCPYIDPWASPVLAAPLAGSEPALEPSVSTAGPKRPQRIAELRPGPSRSRPNGDCLGPAA